jgi:hypothetical protein
MAAPRKRSRISVTRNASQFTRTAGTVGRKRFVGKCIKLARLRVALDRRVELLRVENLKPGTNRASS